MKTRTYSLIAALIVLGSSATYGLDSWNLDLQMRIGSFRASHAPEFLSGNLILTYRAANDRENSLIHYVGAAFRNENYAKIHTFQRNDNGVYFLVYHVPKDVTSIQYRLVVDGLWMADPANPDSVEVPGADVRLSVADVPQETGVPPPSPMLLPGNRVEFEFHSAPGQAIYVAGSFNNWDPYMHRMDEVSPGTYSLTIRVMPGTYYYYFVSDGREMPDPRNTRSAFSDDGARVSVFQVNKS